MVIDCCSQQRSYEKFFGLLAQVSDQRIALLQDNPSVTDAQQCHKVVFDSFQRFCQLNKMYMEEYIKAFNEQVSQVEKSF